MRYAGFTKQERSFITLMRVWMVLFLGLAIVFCIIPEILLNYINDIGKVFLGWQPPPHRGGGYFWLAPAVALHVLLAYSCALAQHSPVRNGSYAKLVIMATFISAAGYVALLFLDSMQFYYLVAAVIDALVFIITWRVYSKASLSRT